MDGEMKMENCGYFMKWRNGGGGDWCSTVDSNGRCHRLALLSSEEIARMAHADVKNIAGDDEATLTVDQNYTNIAQSFEIYIHEITTDAPWWRQLPEITKTSPVMTR